MPIHMLDLGGTACYESKEAVSISLDGTTSDDEVTHNVIGDYNLLPFPDNTFDRALGSCYLEGEYDLKELYRVMTPGGKVKVKACDVEPTREHLQHLGNMYTSSFEVREISTPYLESVQDGDDLWSYDNPFVLVKGE